MQRSLVSDPHVRACGLKLRANEGKAQRPMPYFEQGSPAGVGFITLIVPFHKASGEQRSPRLECQVERAVRKQINPKHAMHKR
jgi:hypothetical protein